MAINQLSTANTFEQWLIATQSLIAFANSITDASGGTFTSNTAEYVITGNLTVGNTVTCVTMNTDVIIFNDGTRLDSNVRIVNAYAHSNAAFNKANAANVLAQQAYDYANTISLTGEIVGDNVQVLYAVVGNTVNANISMSTANITVTSNVTTSNIVASNDITVTKNVSTNNISVTNNVSTGNISVTNLLTTTNLTATLITATDVNTTSDVALKNNIEQIENPLDILEKITGYSFNWKSDGSKSYGFTAQDIEKILPEIVKTRDDGFKGINYLNLIAFLVEAIKELRKEINKKQ